MKKSIHKLISLALIVSGLSFYACQQEDCVAEKQQTILEKIEAKAETRNDDGSVYCNVTTTVAGQVDSLVTVLASEGGYPSTAITHLAVSGPINTNDIKTMCNFQWLDSLVLTDAEIKEIPGYAFQNFKSKAHIILPKSVQTIKEYAFYSGNKETIKSVYVQDSVKSIGDNAFYYCQAMESVRLPKNITVLPNEIFYNCKSLKEVIVPSLVKTIGERAFYGCSSLTKVELPKKLEEIKKEAFRGCSSLVSFQWPSYIYTIPDRCFDDCSNLEFTIPGNIQKIGAHAFSDCKKMTEYKIPAKVESIGEYAFEGTGVTTLTLTDKTLVSKGLFNGSAMTNLTISEGMTSLPDYIFQNCDNLKTLKFPSSLKTIGSYAFNACDGFITIEFNENLETIGSNAFNDNNSLQSITITAKTIGSYAFGDCDKLESVVFSDKLETIGNCAFSNNDLLHDITIPAKTIGSEAFENCDNLEKITLGTSVKSIGNYAFYDCKKLKEVEWNEGLEKIGEYAFYRTNLTEFEAPATLASIGSCAFGYNYTLEEITLNEGLKSLGDYAFRETSVRTIIIPSTLEQCGNNPFQKCLNLTSVFWESKISTPNLSADYDSQTNTLLYLTHGQSHVDNPNQIVNGKSQSPILLRSGGNFHCPESFVSDMKYERVFNRRYDYVSDNVSTENSYDRNYSFQNKIGEASCWQTIVLPFTVTSIKCGDKELVPFGAEKEGAYPFWLRELTPNGFVKATKIEANKPYIIAMPNNAAYADEYNIRGKVVFSAENVTIPVTVELKEVQGPSFNFYPTYTYLGSHAEKLVLNRINEYDDWVTGKYYYYGSVFIPSTYDCPTFHAYVSSPAGGRSVVPIETSLSSRKAHKLGPIPQENDM